MIGQLPPKPTGTGAAAIFAQWVWEQLRQSTLGDVSGSKVNRTTRGNYQIQQSSGGGGTASVEMFRLKSVQGDYVTCRSWDGTTEGETDVFIAKEFKIRNSLASETIYGTANTYTYSDGQDSLNKIRSHTIDATTQNEIVVPPWTIDEIVYAVSATTGVSAGDNQCNYLLIRSSQWARF